MTNQEVNLGIHYSKRYMVILNNMILYYYWLKIVKFEN